MRIYAVADIHGKKERIETLCTILNRFTPDLMVIAGDITCFSHWQSTIFQLDRMNRHATISPPILCIRGNSDLKRIEKSLTKSNNLTLLNRSPHYFQGVPFMGTNGTIPFPFASRICLRENRLLKTLVDRMNKETIFVVHPPPRGICDKVGTRFSAGSQNLFNFIEATQPKMVLCGHIHEQTGMGYVKNTPIVNCAMNKNSQGAIIDLKKGETPRVIFLQPGNGNGMKTPLI